MVGLKLFERNLPIQLDVERQKYLAQPPLGMRPDDPESLSVVKQAGWVLRPIYVSSTTVTMFHALLRWEVRHGRRMRRFFPLELALDQFNPRAVERALLDKDLLHRPAQSAVPRVKGFQKLTMIDQPALECEHPEHEVTLGMGASRHGKAPAQGGRRRREAQTRSRRVAQNGNVGRIPG